MNILFGFSKARVNKHGKGLKVELTNNPNLVNSKSLGLEGSLQIFNILNYRRDIKYIAPKNDYYQFFPIKYTFFCA